MSSYGAPPDMAPDLLIYTGNGTDEIRLSGFIESANLVAVCDRINERLLARRSRGFQEVALDLSGKGLDAIAVGKILKCFSDNNVCVVSLRLSGNRLNDFDIEFALGDFVRAPCNKFLVDIDLAGNGIGDFGCICLLKALIVGRSADRPRATRVRLRDNLISHPRQLIEAVPDSFRPLIAAVGVEGMSFSVSPDQIMVQLIGMDQQQCARARRDIPDPSLKVPVTRPLRGSIREPEAEDLF